jgi:hypothetical protein
VHANIAVPVGGSAVPTSASTPMSVTSHASVADSRRFDTGAATQGLVPSTAAAVHGNIAAPVGGPAVPTSASAPMEVDTVLEPCKAAESAVDVSLSSDESVEVIILSSEDEDEGATAGGPTSPTTLTSTLHAKPPMCKDGGAIHDDACRCGGSACKHSKVWWCEVCGNAGSHLSFFDAAACEETHK